MSAHYTLILGTKNWSSWSLRPYLALRATKAAFDEIVIPLRREDSKRQILQHSPAGKVPILKIEENGNTVTVFDSLAICETLAERHPEAGLWPDAPDTRALARAYACEMHAGFGALRAAMPMEITNIQPTPEMTPELKADIARVLEAWETALTQFGGDGGFLFGRFSIADCMYAPVVTRFRTYSLEVPKIVEDYSKRIFALPAMQDWSAAAQAEVDAGLPPFETTR